MTDFDLSEIHLKTHRIGALKADMTYEVSVRLRAERGELLL